MSDEHSSVPPCWADDPTGRHRFRFWDGATWTGHVFDGEEPPATAPGPPPTAAQYPDATRAQSHEHEQAQPYASEQSQYLAESHDQYAADVGEPVGERQQRSSGGSHRAFWTGALVGGLVVAILGGIAWVTVGGSNSDTSVATHATTTTSRERATTTLASTTTLGTSTTVAGRPPAQVRVEVLNASGKAGAAGAMSDTLKAAGYTIAGLGNATTQKGTTVACETGFDAEAAALAQNVGAGATTQPLASPPPADAANADCLVTLGS
jgi:LytR cell envelope-related transcriptional attenuator/Protein of unknown function (DUF2510)